MDDHYLKKELYQKLRDSDEIFEFLESGSLDGVWYWDIENQEQEWLSPRFKSLFGYENDEVPNTSAWWQENIYPQDLPAVLEKFQRHIEGKGPYDQIVRYRHKDGSTIWVRCRGMAIRDESGKAVRMLGAHTDVTELKLSEIRLNLSEVRSSEAQRMARIGNWDWNLATEEHWWSAERYRISGRHRVSFKPTTESLLETVHPADRRRVAQTLDSARTNKGPFSIQYRTVLPGGSVRTVLSVGQVSFTLEGRPLRMTGTVQDITDRVELEREILIAGEQERERISRNLHDGLGQELTGISLRLRGLSEELAEEHSPHAQAIEDLTAMTQNAIAEIRRVAHDLSPSFLAEVGLGAALGALAEELTKHSEVKCVVNYSVDQDLQDHEIAVNLYRIAQESISNALKHGSPQKIELNVGCDKDSLFLEVLDDGSGIPAKPDRTEGLGLKSMHYRARMLHGHLEVSPRTDGGTRVLCSCPFQPV